MKKSFWPEEKTRDLSALSISELCCSQLENYRLEYHTYDVLSCPQILAPVAQRTDRYTHSSDNDKRNDLSGSVLHSLRNIGILRFSEHFIYASL